MRKEAEGKAQKGEHRERVRDDQDPLEVQSLPVAKEKQKGIDLIYFG